MNPLIGKGQGRVTSPDDKRLKSNRMKSGLESVTRQCPAPELSPKVEIGDGIKGASHVQN